MTDPDLQPTSVVDSSLRGELADSPPSQRSTDEIDHLLLRLQRQVHDVRTDDDSEPAVTANRLADMGRELLDLSAHLDRVDAGSLIAEVEDWAHLCEELSLHDVAEAARKSIDDFFQNAARAWKEGIAAELAQPNPQVSCGKG